MDVVMNMSKTMQLLAPLLKEEKFLADCSCPGPGSSLGKLKALNNSYLGYTQRKLVCNVKLHFKHQKTAFEIEDLLSE